MPTLEPTTEEGRIYECAILIPYPLSQKEEQQLVKEIEGIFSEAGAKQVAKDVWGRRGLAYTIEGATEGSFIIYHYEMDPLKVKDVDQALRIAKGVLRHIFVKPPKGYVIEKYSEKYEQWLKDRESSAEKQERTKEEELTRKVIERAKRSVKVAEEKKETQKAAPMAEEKLNAELEKLISDDTLNL